MKLKDLYVDIYRGKINTFIVLKHKLTNVTITRCVSSGTNLDEYMPKLARKFNRKIQNAQK